jgi:rubrerythrin
MSLIHRQINEHAETNYLTSNSKNKVNQSFKYFLKCKSCLWKITFYEPTGSIHLDNKKMLCPICKERELKSLVIELLS